MHQSITIAFLSLSGAVIASAVKRLDANPAAPVPTSNDPISNSNYTTYDNYTYTVPTRDWTKLGTYCDYFTPCDDYWFDCSDYLGGVCGGPGAYCGSDDDCMATCHGGSGLCGSVVLDALDADGSPVYFPDAGTITSESAWWGTYETDVPDSFDGDGQNGASFATDTPVQTITATGTGTATATATAIRRRFKKMVR